MNFRDEAMRLVTENGYRDLCEVGVWRGELSRMLAQVARTLVLVDPWSDLWNAKYPCTMGEPPAGQFVLNCMYEDVRATVPSALVLRMPSVEAARYVPDGSLDFVFIDAVHYYAECLADIRAWMPKIHPGGMIAGDDYCPDTPEGVAGAVDAYFGLNPRNTVWWEKV